MYTNIYNYVLLIQKCKMLCWARDDHIQNIEYSCIFKQQCIHLIAELKIYSVYYTLYYTVCIQYMLIITLSIY